MAITRTDIAKLYIAMFDRAPEKEGLDYWTNEAASGKDLATIANEMAAAAKAYPDTYPQYANYDPSNPDSVKAVINKVYQILFNKDESTDPDGVNYWVNEVVKNGKDLGTVVTTLEKAAEEYLNSDDPAAKAAAETFVNRAAAAEKIADTLPTADVNGDGKVDANDFNVFQETIKTVTDDSTTIDTALNKAKDYAPATFDFTTAKDEIVGTDGVNTFNGVVSSLSSEATLNSGDKIDGKGGVDTLNVDMKGSFTGVGSDGYIKNVENINLTNNTVLDRSFDATNVSGVEKYNLTGSEAGNAVSLSNVNESGIEINLKNMSNAVTVGFDSNLDLSGTTDAMTLGLDNIGKADPTPNDGSDDTTYTKVTMDKIEDITLNTSEKASYVDLSGLAAATDVVVKGDQDLTVKNGPANIKTFDASQNSGTVKADFTNATAGTLSTIKTSEGDDVVSVKDSTINAGPTIDLGNGDDRLKLDVTAASTIQPGMNGVETLELTGLAGALTFSELKTTGLQKIVVDANADGGNTATFANMGATDIALDVANSSNSALTTTSGTVKLDNSGNTTVNVSDAKATTSATGADNTSVTLINAQAATINVSPSLTETGVYTLNKATNLTVNVDDKLNSSNASTTAFNSKVVASKVTDLTIDAKGTAQLAANSDLSKAQNITLKAENKTSSIGLATNSVDLSAANIANLSGDGQIKLNNVGTNGTTAVDYNVEVTASGLNQGLSFANVASKQDVTMDLSSVLGTVTQTAGNGIAGANVTVSANKLTNNITLGTVDAASAGNGTADLSFENDLKNVTVGNIGGNTIFDTVKINASNVGGTTNIGNIKADNKVDVNSSNALNNVTIGTISQGGTTAGKQGVNDVTVDLSSSLGTNTVGAITAISNLTYKAGLNASALTVNVDNDGTHDFTADLTGNAGNDTFTFTTANDKKETITLKGDLGSGQSGTDVTVNASSITTNTNKATIDLSALKGYTASSTTGGAGNDTITGGAGNDTITTNGGNDIVDGGTGTNTLVINGAYADSADSDIKNINTITVDTSAAAVTANLSNQTEDLTINVNNGSATNAATITTGAGNDTITTGTGNDTITGGAGADTIQVAFGGQGQDTITDFTVGSGNDVWDFTGTSDVAINANNNEGKFASVSNANTGADENIALTNGLNIINPTKEANWVASGKVTDKSKVATYLGDIADTSGTDKIVLGNANDVVYIVVSDNTDSALWKVKGDGTNTTISSSDLILIAKFSGVKATDSWSASNFADFS